jgi:hypothetical protein
VSPTTSSDPIAIAIANDLPRTFILSPSPGALEAQVRTGVGKHPAPGVSRPQ